MLPQTNHSLLFCGGARLLSDHTFQSYSQDRHPFLRLAHRPVPTAELPSGGVCEGEPARRGPLPRRGNGTFQTLPRPIPVLLPPQDLAWRRGTTSLPGPLPGTDTGSQRPPGRVSCQGGNGTLILSPSVHQPLPVPTSASLTFLWRRASVTRLGKVN